MLLLLTLISFAFFLLVGFAVIVTGVAVFKALFSLIPVVLMWMFLFFVGIVWLF